MVTRSRRRTADAHTQTTQRYLSQIAIMQNGDGANNRKLTDGGICNRVWCRRKQYYLLQFTRINRCRSNARMSAKGSVPSRIVVDLNVPTWRTTTQCSHSTGSYRQIKAHHSNVFIGGRKDNTKKLRSVCRGDGT